MECGKFFFGKYDMFVVLSLCFQYPIMVIQSYITFRDKIHKKYMSNVLNQNVNVSKREGFATFE